MRSPGVVTALASEDGGRIEDSIEDATDMSDDIAELSMTDDEEAAPEEEESALDDIEEADAVDADAIDDVDAWFEEEEEV